MAADEKRSTGLSREMKFLPANRVVSVQSQKEQFIITGGIYDLDALIKDVG